MQIYSTPLSWKQASGKMSIVEAVLEFFLAPVNNPTLAESFKKPFGAPDFSFDDLMHRQGRFSEIDCITYVQSKIGNVDMYWIQRAIASLCAAELVIRQKIGEQTFHKLHDDLAKDLISLNLVMPFIFGFSCIASTHRTSVFKVEIRDALGDIHMGSAFLVNLGNQEAVSLLVTNKHVVAGAADIRVLDVNDNIIDHDAVYISADDDIAVIQLRFFQSSLHLSLTADAEVLDEAVTLGYPPIASAAASYQLIHKGEINAKVTSYIDHRDYLIFSAKTAPGNSGGPLVLKTGMVAGMVTSEFFHQLDGSNAQDTNMGWNQYVGSSYFAAICSDRIVAFIDTYVLPLVRADIAAKAALTTA